jgi:hypothetical protein
MALHVSQVAAAPIGDAALFCQVLFCSRADANQDVAPSGELLVQHEAAASWGDVTACATPCSSGAIALPRGWVSAISARFNHERRSGI